MMRIRNAQHNTGIVDQLCTISKVWKERDMVSVGGGGGEEGLICWLELRIGLKV